MGILFLSSEDFYTKTDNSNNLLLCNRINQFSFVLFYSHKCRHSNSVLPIIRSLPGSINGCQFGIINASQHKDIINLSTPTITPLRYVPYMILYYNGTPYMRYDGPHDLENIKSFIVEVAASIQRQVNTAMTSGNENINNNEDDFYEIPEYCIAIPRKGDQEEQRICYLNFSQAYNQN